MNDEGFALCARLGDIDGLVERSGYGVLCRFGLGDETEVALESGEDGRFLY